METPAALNRIVQFQAALIEELFQEKYKCFLTSRFQSDALETRYGARSLVATK